MKTVSNILQEKGNQVYSVLPSALMFDALQIMSDKEIGALLVMEDDLIQGILSERDYARKVVLLGKSSKEIKVSEIMSEIVYYIRPSNTVEDCMAIMTEKRIRHLPVLENKKVAGMISIGDVVKAMIDDKNLVIDQLVNYIKGA
jgi:CBS domain-containing protein